MSHGNSSFYSTLGKSAKAKTPLQCLLSNNKGDKKSLSLADKHAATMHLSLKTHMQKYKNDLL